MLFGTEAWLDVVYTHVAGIDVQKKQVTVTVRTPDPRRPGRREKTRTFRTFYADLLAMGSWLAECGVTRVAMESTARTGGRCMPRYGRPAGRV